jgi:hypothetical protein
MILAIPDNRPMPQKFHLIIPGAVLPRDAGETASTVAPAPPRLRALLAAMEPAARIECAEDSPATPCELAVAEANALPGGPGHIPWAAFETGTVGTPCAFIKLCHLQVGADHILLLPPEDLGVDVETSRVLLAAMAPYFLEDGITLQAYGAVRGTWLATGEPFRNLRTVSTDQVVGRRLTRSMLESTGGSAAVLRRLQNEMQMLLYTHPANETRQHQRLLPINSFWVTGAGLLDAKTAPAADVQVEPRLYAAALRRDAVAHAKAWQDVDADICADLLARLRAGEDVRLTLCSEKAAQTFVPAKTGVWHQLKSVLGLQPRWNVREQL